MSKESVVGRLERENQRYWEWTGSLVSTFFAGNPDRDQMLEWLKQRCWNEIKTVHWSSEILRSGGEEMSRRGDFELIQSIGKQVWDEARHYRLLADCVRNLGGSMNGFKAYPTWERMFRRYMRTIGSGDLLFAFAGSMFTGEGSASITAPIIVKECSNAYPDVSHAYAIIDRDERFHKDNGRRGIERYATSAGEGRRALKIARLLREEQVRAWQEIYGIRQKR